jgi:hypothetical protein
MNTHMSSNSVIPQDDGAWFPFDTGLEIACLVDVVVQEFEYILWTFNIHNQER